MPLAGFGIETPCRACLYGSVSVITVAAGGTRCGGGGTAEGSPRAERQKGKLRQSHQGAGPSNATHLAQTSR